MTFLGTFFFVVYNITTIATKHLHLIIIIVCRCLVLWIFCHKKHTAKIPQILSIFHLQHLFFQFLFSLCCVLKVKEGL